MCGLYVFQIMDECIVDDPFYVAGGMALLKKGSGCVLLYNDMRLHLWKKSGGFYLSVDNPLSSSHNPLLCGLHVIQRGGLRVD